MRIKSTCFLFSFFIASLVLKGQDSRYTDSLTDALRLTKADTTRAKILNELVWEFIYNDPNRSIEYAKEELALSEKINFERGIFDSYTSLGSITYIKSDLAAALTYHRKALAISQKANYQKGLMISNSNIGIVYKDLGDHVLETQYCLAALKIAEGIHDTMRLSSIYANLGLAYQSQKNHARALEYNNKALAIREKRNDTRGIASCYINIASVLTDQHKYEEALPYQLKAIELAERIKDNYLLAKCYSNISMTYKNLHQYNPALDYLAKGLKINEALKSKASQAAININIGEVYNKLEKSREALTHFETALKIAKEIGHKKWQMEVYAGMSYSYESLKNIQKSYECYYNYSQLRDTMTNEDYNKQIANMQVLYETGKKESEIQILKQQQEIKSLHIKEQDVLLQKRKYLLGTSMVIIISLIFTGYFYFSRQKIRSLQKQEQAVRDTEESERLRIAKDIHDDLGSGLSKIKFLAELASGKSANNPDVVSSIRSISETSTFLVENMRDLIWALDPENAKLESLIARIREYSNDYLAEFPIELIVNISEEIPDKEITKEANRNIFFIVKESLQNIVKHAKASVVKLSIELKDNEFKMGITDNGIGLSENNNKNGNGLKNIKQRASAINSLVELRSLQNSGTFVSMIVSLKNIEKT